MGRPTTEKQFTLIIFDSNKFLKVEWSGIMDLQKLLHVPNMTTVPGMLSAFSHSFDANGKRSRHHNDKTAIHRDRQVSKHLLKLLFILFIVEICIVLKFVKFNGIFNLMHRYTQ